MIAVTDLLYKFVIRSHRCYARTINKINIFGVSIYSLLKIFLFDLLALSQLLQLFSFCLKKKSATKHSWDGAAFYCLDTIDKIIWPFI